jgi:hypothetical protein
VNEYVDVVNDMYENIEDLDLNKEKDNFGL